MIVDPYAVTAQEAAEYDSFCHHHLAYLNRYPPDSLWHYTTAATFAVIMKSKVRYGRHRYPASTITWSSDTVFGSSEKLSGSIRCHRTTRTHSGLLATLTMRLKMRVRKSRSFSLLCMSEAKDDL